MNLELLKSKYFLEGEDLNKFVTRIVKHIHGDNFKDGTDLYNAIINMQFVPSSPTLYNAGTSIPQCSSCFIQHVEDNLWHIYESIQNQALLSKYAGGIAQNWTSVRGSDSSLRDGFGKSQGIIPFIKCVESTTIAVNQSGKRQGACCVYLEPWHMDIEYFIDLRKEDGNELKRTHHIHTALWIPDLFMERVKRNEKWTLFCPHETKYRLNNTWGKEFERIYVELEKNEKIRIKRTVSAVQLWRNIINSTFTTGHPWICFKDTVNKDNPQNHLGMIRSSNLCTEITLNTSEKEIAVCNLGSINLANLGDDSDDKLRNIVNIGVKSLNSVIDHNYYTCKEAENTNKMHRPIGLGFMGFADYIYQRGLHFTHPDINNITDVLFSKLKRFAINASVELAKEHGVYDSWSGSRWYKEGIELRNSHLLAIAPTATISAIAGCCPSIEPPYSNIFTKSLDKTEIKYINNHLRKDLEKCGIPWISVVNDIINNDGSVQGIYKIPDGIQEKYKTAFEIDQFKLIDLASIRQKYICQSQSLNLFIHPNNARGKYISDLYLYAWEKGIKTTYYLHAKPSSFISKNNNCDVCN